MPRSLTLEEARSRARTVRAVDYAVHLDLRSDDGYLARTTVRFGSEPGSSTFLDLQGARRVRATLNGNLLPEDCYRADRLQLGPLEEQNVAVVEAQMPYVSDGDGMNRFVDPADGQVYLGCYGGMDVTRRVLACFDQPDLKAPFTLTVTARPGWSVLSNGTASADGDTWTFAHTPPMATYLLSVCAGPWASRRWDHAGLTFGWHCRASQADDLERDLPGLRSVTEAAFDHYAGLFTEPYAFGDYDQIFVPGHNWGAMESPGCVTFRDELLPAGVTDAALARDRAMVVAHEMAHMWFGDLVTFRWWEDTWLNESFADYLGFVVGGVAVPGHNALAEFDLASKAGAYAADARPSSHPVAPTAEEVPDVDAAFSNFDAISYAKGNTCLRQLAFWLGEETFVAGVDRHLTDRRFGTAELVDLVDALAAVTDRDVRGWADAWLRTTGYDRLLVHRDGSSSVCSGSGMPFLRREGSRPHRVRVSGYDRSDDGGLARAWERVVDLGVGSEEVPLPEADLIVPNSTGETFARVVLDARTRSAVDERLAAVPDEHPRTLLWATLLDEAAVGRLPAPDVVRLVERHLAGERSAVILEHVLRRTVVLAEAAAVPDEVPALLERLSVVAQGVLGRSHLPTAVAEAATGSVIATSHDRELLLGWLATGGPAGPLSPRQRWDTVIRLAVLGHDVEDAVRAELEADDSSAGRLSALTARAAVPDAEAKHDALERLLTEGTSNRELTALARGVWSAEQRQLVDPLLPTFLDRSRAVAARGQAIALVVGRATPTYRWTEPQLLDLERHAADADLPPVLARTWADLLHDQRQLASGGPAL